MSTIQAQHAFDVLHCLSLAVSLLVVPVTFTTLVTLSWRCYRERRFLQALPLLATMLNSALIWACLSTYMVGHFSNTINGTQILKDGSNSLPNLLIKNFLINLIYLEPLNLFLYTWRFLSELEQSVTNPISKTFLKWFARISIFLIPPALITVVVTWIFVRAKWSYYILHLNPQKEKHYSNI